MTLRSTIDPPKTYPASSLEAPADAGTTAPRSRRHDAPQRPSFAQAACMLLLASPLSAVARMLAPPQNSGRNLLESCITGPWSAARGGGETGLGRQPLSIQRVTTANQWISARNNSCVPGGVETLPAHDLTFAFDSAVGPQSPFDPLDAATQKQVRQDLATLSQSVNLTFHEVSVAPLGRANLLFFRSRTADSQTSGLSWGSTSPGYLVQPDVAGVFQGRANGPDSERLAAIGSALGLTFKGQLGYNDTNGAQGKFITNTMSSVTFARENTCVQVNQFGPLDLAALSLKYGLPSLDTVRIFDIRDTNNSAGIITNQALGDGAILPDGHSGNTLRAIYNGTMPLQLSLANDGSSVTRVGNAYRMLAPTSSVLNADISQTLGGVVIGNNGTNHLVGSDFDDVFRVGSGQSNITTGAGVDSIILNYPNAEVTVADFSAQDTLYAPSLTNRSGVVVTPQSSGVSLSLPGDTSVSLPGVQSFNLTRSLVVGTNPPNNFVITPCILQQSAPVAPPAPPPPPTVTTTSSGTSSTNPCANIGAAGMGGAWGACGSSLGLPGLVPQVAWAP